MFVSDHNEMEAPSAGTPDAQPLDSHPKGLMSHKHFWLRYLTFAIFIKTLCIVGNIGMAFAPMKTVNEIKRTQETGVLDSLPYLAIMSTGTQWCFYGLFAWAYTGNKGFLVVLYANILGAVLGSYYAFIFQKHCRNDGAWTAMLWYASAIGTLFVGQCIILFLLPMERGLLFCGCLAAFLSVVVTLSPLSTLREILKTKSVRSMPIELTIVSAGSSIVWTVCGVMLHDWWILIPNILGIFVGSLTTYLIFKYSTYFQDIFSPKFGLWLLSGRGVSETTRLRQGRSYEVYGCKSDADGCTGGTH